METKILTQERLKAVLNYNPESGEFTWKGGIRGARKGNKAGYRRADGYRQIRIDCRLYYAHRLAILYTTGVFPVDTVDHKNRIPGDDRILNLRCTTNSQNMANSGAQKGSSSRYKGVSWHQASNKWMVRVMAGGINHYLGTFIAEDKAAEAYNQVASEWFGDYAYLNVIGD